MAVFLNRKIFPPAVNGNGGGELNVNGALGLTTGVAGENLLENDLIFKSPDVVTDWTVDALGSGFGSEETHLIEVNGNRFLVGAATTVAPINVWKYNPNGNVWDLVFSAPENNNNFLYQYVSHLVPVSTTQFIIVASLRHNLQDLPNAFLIRTAIHYFDITSNTVVETHFTNSYTAGNDSTFNRGLKKLGVSLTVKNNKIYFFDYVAAFSYSFTTLTNVPSSKIGLRFLSFDLNNKTYTTHFTVNSQYGIGNGIATERIAHTIYQLDSIWDDDDLLVAYYRTVQSGNNVTPSEQWTYVNSSLTAFLPVNNFTSSTINLHFKLFSFNNNIYLISQRLNSNSALPVLVKPKGVGQGDFTLLISKMGSDFGLPGFDRRRTTTVFYNGVLYFIALFETSPFFASLAFINNDWVLLQAPQLPINQNYGQITESFIGGNPFARSTYILGNKILFLSELSNITYLWETTTNGVFRPKWIKNQQLFTDAIGIAQQTKNANENVGVYQMTPNNSL